jgi:flagellar biosynthetic protein FlhB
MAEENDNDDDKTEEPTDKRLADAIERGNTPVSREVAFLASLIAYLLVEIYALPSTTPGLAAAMAHFLDDPSGWRLETAGDARALTLTVASIMGRFLGPAVFLLMAFGVGGSIIQNPPRVVAQRIEPDFKRLSPFAGFARLFGPRGWTEFGKAMVKLGVVGVSVALVVASQRLAMIDAMFVDTAGLPGRLLSLCVAATAAITLAVLILAGADFTWTRIHWRRDQRMSRYEVKEEVKQAEGDRMLKARLRSLRLDRSRRNMMKAVPKATMVIVNPTHYAVAMRYVRSEGGAPVVLAKGVDLFALKIRDIALEHGVPVIEDKALARSLYDVVTVDAVIPQEFYRAVAEIVHLINSKRAAWPLNRRRLN